MRAITFNELRKIKDSLPDGSMHRIADELGLNVDTVRNFFGGQNFKEGKSVGIHLEPGPDGGLVMIDDTTVLDLALNYYETKHYIFVHSWLPTLLSDEGELSLDPNWREANYLGWLRAKWINPVMMYQNGLFDTNKTIVSGHWHVNAFHALYDEDKEKGKTNYNPFVTPKFIGLDACTIVSKQVNCIVLEDEET